MIDKNPAKSHKINDIEHPGKTAPSPNSKSVIVTHRSIMRDPMMSSGATGEPGSEPVPVTRISGTGNAVVQPLHQAELSSAVATEPAEPAEAEPAAAPSEAAPTPQADKAPETEPAAPAEAEPAAPAPQAAAPTEPAPAEPADGSPIKTSTEAQLGTKSAQSDVEVAAAEDAEAKRQAELLEMIESKKYYLPINTLEKQRTKQFMAGGILLSLLLAVVWADIALDAGLIKIGHLRALTHFFN